jgi:fatty acid-binding protein DegV
VKTLSKICVIDSCKILDNLERRLLRELSKEEYKHVLGIIIEEKISAYKEYNNLLKREIEELSTLLNMKP